MICLTQPEDLFAKYTMNVHKFYDICESYYSGFVPFGRPNELIELAQQSEAHIDVLASFIHWIAEHKQHPLLKPKRPLLDKEL